MEHKIDNSLETFAEIVSQALTEASREGCTATLITSASPAQPDSLLAKPEALWFAMKLGGSLEGHAYFALHADNVPALDLREAPEAAEAATLEATPAPLLGLFKSMAQRLQRLALSRFGSVTATLESTSAPALANVSIFQITARSGKEHPPASLYLCFEPQLAAALERASGVLFPEAAPGGKPPVENLGLVLDVELAATLRFGQRQLSLRDVLDLSSGSVVELDRQVDEPVELILDGRVIARGEAVIIDGNYGMRITEILQPVSGIARTRWALGPTSVYPASLGTERD